MKFLNEECLTVSDFVFRGYTAEKLERQYNARAAVPDCEKIFAEWRTRSADYRKRGLCELDVAYGSSTSETVDLFLPNQSNTPVVVFIHGGYWRSMDKSDFSYLAEGLVDRGALVAVVNYGLCPAVTMDDIVRQMQTACEWLYRHCRKYGGDPNSIHVSGHSAGGQLTALLMATAWPSLSPDLPAGLVKSGLPISGLFELEPMLYLPLNRDLRLDQESAHRNSPALLQPRTNAVLSIVVGGAESGEFRRQSYDFAKNWGAQGARTEYVEMSGLNHFTILDQMKNTDNPLTAIMLGHVGLI
jgi:arylformamidase